MKEKETATCPICGGELQVQGQALFKEHHERLWEKKSWECGAAYDIGYRSFGKAYHSKTSRLGGVEIKDKPTDLILWEAENPIPDVDLIDFAVQLANRVTALEAALAEKGGAR